MNGIFYYDGTWYDENPGIVGPGNLALWGASAVFDGARSIEGLAPDLDLHCARLIESSRSLGHEPKLDGEEVAELCREAIRKLPKDAVTYVRPMFVAMEGKGIIPDPDSTAFMLSVTPMPMPAEPNFSACLSSFRRPARDMAPTNAKAACLYPNIARALKEARKRGYSNAIMLDPNGNVAEFANANLWIVKDGVVRTPMPNGTFLNGITRQRVLGLLRDAGHEVEECVLGFEDVMDADEVFNSGNMGKVMPCTKIGERELQPGPVFKKAYELYFDFAASSTVF